MTTFDSREQSFENKFAHDEQLRFKVTNRRNKLLGQWAAGLLGKTGDDAAAYAKEVVMADFEAPGDDDVLQKVLADLKQAGVETDAAALRSRMDALIDDAKQQIMSEG